LHPTDARGFLHKFLCMCIRDARGGPCKTGQRWRGPAPSTSRFPPPRFRRKKRWQVKNGIPADQLPVTQRGGRARPANPSGCCVEVAGACLGGANRCPQLPVTLPGQPSSHTAPEIRAFPDPGTKNGEYSTTCTRVASANVYRSGRCSFGGALTRMVWPGARSGLPDDPGLLAA